MQAAAGGVAGFGPPHPGLIEKQTVVIVKAVLVLTITSPRLHHDVCVRPEPWTVQGKRR